MNDIFRDLDGMLEACARTSRRTQAVVAIVFCINEGITFGQQIIGVLRRKGFSPRHVAILLQDLSGDDTACPIWHRDAEGHYRNLRTL
jgi:predicted metal-dependent phosphotriesterase family hydrolase